MRYNRVVVLSIVLLLSVFGKTSSAQWNMEGLKLMEVVDKVSKYYVDSVNEGRLVERTITDMLHELDPHSSYISKEDLKEMQEQLEGEFEGVGISFNVLDDTIFVISTIQGGPAEQVGIRAGDRIIKIDEENVAGIGIKAKGVQTRLKGEKGTKVNVTVLRRSVNKLLKFTITRDKIPFYSLDASYMIDKHTGYIKLSRFSQTTADEFESAIKELNDKGMNHLVLDLSSNGGGYLRIAVELADHFLGKDRRIVYTKGDKVPRRDYDATARGLFEEGRLVIMIDENSASASEILSGAIQEWDRGILVGRRSFGKGLVQQPFRLNDGSEMRLTIARYYTPTGRLIQKSYDNGYDDYAMDIINRYNEGELNSADSIFFPESEKYKTLILGRTVYGGGGIMPDYFVPLDTSGYSDYYRDLINLGLFNQFILQYVDQNRDNLMSKYKEFPAFKKSFEPSQALLEELILFAEQEGLAFNESEFEASKSQLSMLLKAYIARDLWSTGRFYEIYNESNPVFIKAREIATSSRLYREKLK